MKLAVLALALATATVAPQARADDPDAPRIDVRISELAAPLGQKPGEDMPVYVSYSTQTSFSGIEGTRYLTEPMFSNTVSVPRSTLGGPSSYEWVEGIGVIYGPGPTHPTDHRLADNLYVWSHYPPTTTVHGGDDLGHMHTWFTRHEPWVADPAPSGDPGVLGWEHRAAWSTSVGGTTSQYPTVAFSRGTTVSSPVAANYESAMLLDHAFLEARGGDVMAPAGGLVAPAITMGGDEPVGSDMAFQMLNWTTADSYHNVSVVPDWNAGRASAIAGSWRLPVSVTLPAGDGMPERQDLEGVATPQYTLPLTALGIPEDEDQPPGQQVIRLVTNLRPGQRVEGAMAVRQPDGSLLTSPVLIDEPGPRTWRVEDGRLVLEASPEQGYVLAGAPSGDGPAVTLPASPDEPIPADGPRFETNAAGRIVARDVRYGDLQLLDSFDVARVMTEEGPVELGPHNRDGQAVVLESPDGHELWSRTAYKAGGVFVSVEMVLLADTFAFYLDAHPLDGAARPYRIESVADPGGSMNLADNLLGPVERATTFLDAEVPPVENVPINGGRLLIGDEELTLTAITDAGGNRSEVEVRNTSSPARGEPLTDPIIVSRTAGPVPYAETLVYPFYVAVDHAARPTASGRFAGMRTYRLTRQRNDVIAETRDLDGAEPFGIAFSAVDAAGQPLGRSAITSLFVDVRTLDGDVLFQRTVSPNFSPDGGATWGVALVPVRELPPADVVVSARAVHAGGVARSEASPGVPTDRWRFRVDRLPLMIAGTEGGIISGTTEPGSTVRVGVPELGITTQAIASDGGGFSAQLDLSSAPGGEYEVVVEATGPWSEDPERALSALVWPNMTDAVPDDERAVATTRLRHIPGGTDPSMHRTGPPRRPRQGSCARTAAWATRCGRRRGRFVRLAMRRPERRPRSSDRWSRAKDSDGVRARRRPQPRPGWAQKRWPGSGTLPRSMPARSSGGTEEPPRRRASRRRASRRRPGWSLASKPRTASPRSIPGGGRRSNAS